MCVFISQAFCHDEYKQDSIETCNKNGNILEMFKVDFGDECKLIVETTEQKANIEYDTGNHYKC